VPPGLLSVFLSAACRWPIRSDPIRSDSIGRAVVCADALLVASVGDSRAVLAKAAAVGGAWSAERLTTDHSVDNQKERVRCSRHLTRSLTPFPTRCCLLACSLRPALFPSHLRLRRHRRVPCHPALARSTANETNPAVGSVGATKPKLVCLFALCTYLPGSVGSHVGWVTQERLLAAGAKVCGAYVGTSVADGLIQARPNGPATCKAAACSNAPAQTRSIQDEMRTIAWHAARSATGKVPHASCRRQHTLLQGWQNRMFCAERHRLGQPGFHLFPSLPFQPDAHSRLVHAEPA
jgi:hypothetical protein